MMTRLSHCVLVLCCLVGCGSTSARKTSDAESEVAGSSPTETDSAGSSNGSEAVAGREDASERGAGGSGTAGEPERGEARPGTAGVTGGVEARPGTAGASPTGEAGPPTGGTSEGGSPGSGGSAEEAGTTGQGGAPSSSGTTPRDGIWIGGAIESFKLDAFSFLMEADGSAVSDVRASHAMCPLQGVVAQGVIFDPTACSYGPAGIACQSGTYGLSITFVSDRCADAVFSYATQNATCGRTVQGTTTQRVCWVEEPCTLVGALSLSADPSDIDAGTTSAVTARLGARYPAACPAGVDGVSVLFALDDGDLTGSSVTPGEVTAEDGEARTELTAGAHTGTARVRATVTDATGFTHTASATVSVARPPCEPFTPEWPQADPEYTIDAGESAELTVFVRDPYVTDCSQDPIVTFELVDPSETGSSIESDTVQTVDGQATVRVNAGSVLGTFEIIARVTNSFGEELSSSCSVGVREHPCAIDAVEVTLEPSTAYFGQETEATVVLVQRDDCSEPLPDLTATLKLTDASGTGTTAPATLELSEGEGSATLMAGYVAGTVNVVVSIDGTRLEHLTDSAKLTVRRDPCDPDGIYLTMPTETTLGTSAEVSLSASAYGSCSAMADVVASVTLDDPDGTGCQLSTETATLTASKGAVALEDCQDGGTVSVTASITDSLGESYEATKTIRVAPIITRVEGLSLGKVRLSGDFLYGVGSGALRVVDVSNRTAPDPIGEVTLSSNARGAPRIAGTRAYVAAGADGLHIVDITTPESPALLGTLVTAGNVSDAVQIGSYVYAAAGEQGLLVVDVSDPSLPTVAVALDFPDAYPWAGTIAIAANGSQVQLVDDGTFYVVDVSSPTTPTVTGALDGISASCILPFPGYSVTGRNTGTSTLHVLDTSTATPSELGSIANLEAYELMAVGDDIFAVDMASRSIHVIDVAVLSAPRKDRSIWHGIAATSLAVTGDGYGYLPYGSVLSVLRID
ncbi:MAG: hypothetical protein JW940_09350 [Polyangiaceae bacterium]|nr:hypothetical protein [Polyangiaceae bacterium]